MQPGPMTNHPNRSKAPTPGANPTPEQIRQERLAAGLTQRQSADLIWSSTHAWEQWEGGTRRMPYVTWWAYLRRIEGMEAS